MKSLITTYFICLIVSVESIAQQSLQTAVFEFQNLPELEYASWSFYAFDLNENKDIFNVNSKGSLIPASTLKLFTSALAYLELGPDFRFETRLAYSGEIKDDVLNGDLFIIGGGDPCFGDTTFNKGYEIDSIISILKEKGIDKIEGDLVVDISHFDNTTTPETWVYQDMGNYYGAGPSSLTFQRNMFTITFKQEERVNVECKIINYDYDSTDLKIDTWVKSGPYGSGDRAYVYGAPLTSNYLIKGTIPPGKGEFTIKAADPNPPLNFLKQLKQELEKNNLIHKGEMVLSTDRIKNLHLIHIFYSPELSEIVKEINVNSNNLFAENLRLELEKRIPDEYKIKDLSYYLEKYEFNPKGFYINDGSGLSRYNAHTTSHQIRLLEYIYDNEKSFIELMAQGGTEGTVKNMFESESCKFRVKSGTLQRVKAYSGFCLAKNGKDRAFSFIVNNYDGSSYSMKKKMENVIMQLCE